MITKKFMEGEKILKDYSIVWYINSICNYKCSYCIRKNDRDYNPSNNKIEEWKIDDLCQKIKLLNCDNYRFYLVGGETTLYPNLLDFMYRLKNNLGSKLKKINIDTNGSKSFEYFKEYIELKEIVNFCFSIHHEYFEWDLIEKMEKIKNFGLNVTFNLLYNPNNKKLTHQIYKYFKNNNYIGKVSLILSNDDEFKDKKYYYNYDLKTKEITQQLTDKLNKNHRFKNLMCGNYCLVGSDKLSISPEGTMNWFCPKYSCCQKSISFFYQSNDHFKKNIFAVFKCPFKKPPKYCLNVDSDQQEPKLFLQNLKYKILNGNKF